MLTILISSLLSLSKPNLIYFDTTDNWQLYQNRHLIAKFPLDKGKNTATISKYDFKPTDTLIIRYFRDTPCHDCITKVSVKNQSGKVLYSTQGKGTFQPLKISIKDLYKSGVFNYNKLNFYYKDNIVDFKLFVLEIK